MEKNEVYRLGLIVEDMTPAKASYLIIKDNTLYELSLSKKYQHYS